MTIQVDPFPRVRRPTRSTPSLQMRSANDVTPRASGSYNWLVHRHQPPVAFLVSPLAGLGTGDEVEISISLAAGSILTLTTQGPTNLLKTEGLARQRTVLTLADDSYLEYLPWVTIPFAGSRASVEVDLRIASSATFVGWEHWTVGRTAMGERYEFDEFASSWVTTIDGMLMLDDRSRFTGVEAELTAASMAQRTHCGTLVVAGRPVDDISLARAREILRSRLGLVGVGRPEGRLLVARALARSAEEIERGFWPIVAAIREQHGLEPPRPERIARRWF